LFNLLNLYTVQACSQPSDNGEGCFPQILDLFQGFKVGVPSDCLGETSKAQIYMVSLLDFINFVS